MGFYIQQHLLYELKFSICILSSKATVSYFFSSVRWQWKLFFLYTLPLKLYIWLTMNLFIWIITDLRSRSNSVFFFFCFILSHVNSILFISFLPLFVSWSCSLRLPSLMCFRTFFFKLFRSSLIHLFLLCSNFFPYSLSHTDTTTSL
jgi:hypothetical protein